MLLSFSIETPKQKAAAVAKVNKTGVTHRVKKIRTSVHFHRPHTLRLARKPKVERVSVGKTNKLDKFAILKYPLTTESAIKKISDENTLVFIVDIRANKHHIADAVKKMYNVKAERINTLIRPDGQKKAYIRLASGDKTALDIANEIGAV